jgi:hypothetical protein
MPVIRIVPFPGPQGSPGPGNIDGGRAGSIYIVDQQITGGDANGQQSQETVGG